MNIKLTLAILFLLINLHLLGQSKVEYGSNNGKYLEIDNTKIYYEQYGEGSPVLLLHGGMGSISNFNTLIPDLSKHFKLIAIDSPSHGRSYSIDSLSYNILAEYIVKIVDKLKLDKVDIVGYSDGAIVGMLVADKIPNKINKIVFGAGALSPHASKTEGLKMLQNFSPEILPDEYAKSYKDKSPNPNHWEEFVYDSKEMWLQDIWIPREILPKINSKVLVLFGDRDQFIPLNHSIEIYKDLPNSELCILPNTYHDIFNNSKATNSVLIKFLSEN
jgi:pimeloyl-ACP methyl ester carboxylesterase